MQKYIYTFMYVYKRSISMRFKHYFFDTIQNAPNVPIRELIKITSLIGLLFASWTASKKESV